MVRDEQHQGQAWEGSDTKEEEGRKRAERRGLPGCHLLTAHVLARSLTHSTVNTHHLPDPVLGSGATEVSKTDETSLWSLHSRG